MKAVHIFVREDGGIHDRLADRLRQWRLDENTMQTGIGIELRDQGQQLCLRGFFRQYMGLRDNAQISASLLLSAHVDPGGGVFADAHEGEAGNCSAFSQLRHALRQLSMNQRGNGAAVNEFVWGCDSQGVC